MKATHVQRWCVCESCDTRVPSTWGEPADDGAWLCRKCTDAEHRERETEAGGEAMAVWNAEGWGE